MSTETIERNHHDLIKRAASHFADYGNEFCHFMGVHESLQMDIDEVRKKSDYILSHQDETEIIGIYERAHVRKVSERLQKMRTPAARFKEYLRLDDKAINEILSVMPTDEYEQHMLALDRLKNHPVSIEQFEQIDIVLKEVLQTYIAVRDTLYAMSESREK